ncbi:hypothetical protein ACK6D9_00725 [Hoeflea sp. Naph1]|uniref:hypothetical protein n=1 Tax=Hoeflea sp. Naph1 TaxID=3388653 RepID=UPI00398FFB8F
MRVFRKRNWTFFKWEPEPIVFGQYAALVAGDREVELVFTKAQDRKFHWEVLCDARVIAAGIETTKSAARHAAETAARRALIRIA